MPTAKEKEEARMAELRRRFSNQITQKKETQFAKHTTIAGALWYLWPLLSHTDCSLGSTVIETISALPLPPQAVFIPHQAAHQADIVSENPELPAEPKSKTQVCLFFRHSIYTHKQLLDVCTPWSIYAKWRSPPELDAWETRRCIHWTGLQLW